MSSAPPVLFVGCFAEPDAIGMNRLLAHQAQELCSQGMRVEILTWPMGDGWRGPIPDEGCDRLAGMPYLRVVRHGVLHHVVRLPGRWGERVPTDDEWDQAVRWGRDAISQLAPAIVHQHYWQHTWWAMQSAIDLGIPVVHSTYDYGIGCLRTVLVKGDDTLCDAKPSVRQCVPCILRGRSGIGLVNELAAATPGLSPMLDLGFADDGQGVLERRGAVRLPVWQRVGTTLARCNRILPNVSAVVVTSPFAADYFVHLGAARECVTVLPWFYDGVADAADPPPAPPLRLAFVGRVSEEKGVHVLVEALSRVPAAISVELEIAGGTDSEYVRGMRRRFGDAPNGHAIRWLGWQSRAGVHAVLRRSHAAVFPSLWYDNTPAAMVEAVAHHNAIVVTDVPSMTHIARPEENALAFPMADATALASIIVRLSESPGLVDTLRSRSPALLTRSDHARRLSDVYSAAVRRSGASRS